jgi:TonB-linked SusC/RagA family outer membrane protein
MKSLFAFAFSVINISIIYGQNRVISGKVLGADNSPLEFALVSLKNSQTSSYTNQNGEFTITQTQNVDTLTISHLGYETFRADVNRIGESNITFRLITQNASLNEVIVSTGYQYLPKERATGAFEVINNTALNRRVSTNILERLEGISGIYFDRRNGNENISIRGRSTLSADANVLIVVDNFPYDGDISNINPNDVENITVLKDAAAASIWGVKAGNGVIVITTKRGNFGRRSKLEVNLNYSLISRPDLYYAPVMSSTDFIEFEKFLYENKFHTSILNGARKDIVSPLIELLLQKDAGIISERDANQEIDRLKVQDVRRDFNKYFYQLGINQQYAINYRGGTPNFAYIFSLGWDKNRSSSIRNGNERINLRYENTVKISNKLEILLGVNYSQINSETNNPGLSGIQPASKVLYPYASLVSEDGTYKAIPKDYRSSYLSSLSDLPLQNWSYKPLEELNLANNSSKKNDLRIIAGLTFKVYEGLTLTAKYQNQNQFSHLENLISADSYTARNLINLYSTLTAGSLKLAIPIGGIQDNTYAVQNSQSFRTQINYSKKWHNFQEVSIITGYELRQRKSRSNTFRLFGYSDDNLTFQMVNTVDLLPTFDNLRGNSRIPNGILMSNHINRYISFFGNAGYSIRRKYNISASVRKDASNLFGVSANQKGVPLWSSGIAWDIDKEKFLNNNIITKLRLRLTYGFSGNVDQSISALPTFTYSNNSYMTGLYYANLYNPGNPDLRWEKTSTLNIGLDISTATRISGSFDFYKKYGIDLIGESPIDPTTGVTTPMGAFAFKGNVADMESYGFDFELHGKTIKGKLALNSDILINYTENKLTKYKTPLGTANSYVGLINSLSPIEGNSLNGVYSFKWAGLDGSTGDPVGIVEGNTSKNYQAILNSPVTTLNFHGSAIPLLFTSFRNTLSYKRAELSLNLVGKWMYFFRRSSINYNSLMTNWNGHKDYKNRWQNPGDEKYTNVPSLIYPNQSSRDSFYNGSEATIEKGDHIRIQDINFTYTLLNKRSVSPIKLYIYLNNIGIIWKANKAGLDPDYNDGGIPLPLSFSAGCSFQL